MSAKDVSSAQARFHAETVLSGLEFSLGLARNHDDALSAIDSAIAQLEPVPTIEITGPSREFWALSGGFRVPTRKGRFRYFPTEDKAREFAAVIGANEIECSPRHALESKREQEEQAKPWAAVVMSVVGSHVFGESRFDTETEARAEFEARREHAKENGGAAQLKRDHVRIDGFNHFCPND